MPLTPARVLKTFKYAMYFDGVDDYVLVKDSDSLHIFGEITIFYWTVPYFTTTYRDITSKWDGITTHEMMVTGLTGYYKFFAIHRNTATNRIYVETSKTYASGVWYAVAMRCDLKTLDIIVDTERTSTTYTGTPYPNTGNLYIGQRGDNQYWYQGFISQLLIYSRALSDQEILWNYQHPENPIRSGLVLWLQAHPDYVKDIDGDGVLEWVDLSGFGNHGKIYGAQLVQLVKPPRRTLSPSRVLPVAR
jgi:hypothetical protein